MLANNEPSLGVERQAVGADGPAAGDVALEHRIDEGTHSLCLGPLIDGVGSHVGKQKPRFALYPHGPLREDEPVGQLLDASVGGNERVESRVDAQNGSGTRGRWLVRAPTGHGYGEGE